MEPMNFLLLMDDEHSQKALGCYGHPLVRTPNIDALAASGVRFENAYTNCPICVPARASFATGRYVHEIGAWDNAHPYEGEPPGWCHRLQENGMRTTSVGKLHYRSADCPVGFDEQIIPLHLPKGGLGDIFSAVRDEKGLPPRNNPEWMAERIGPGESKYIAYDAQVTELAREWLLHEAPKCAGRPWALFVSLTCPHFPFIAPPEFYGLYPLEDVPLPKPHPSGGRGWHPWIAALHECAPYDVYFDDHSRRVALASYFGMISYVDSNVGGILNALEESGFAESTRVLFASDHGDNLGERGLWGKSTMYEESVAVPLILSGPDVPGGRVCRTPVSLVDLHPTALDGAGLLTSGEEERLRGGSLFRIASEPDDPEREIFSEFHALGAKTGLFMLRRGRYKYIHYVGHAPELFDLEEDPEERRDLSRSPAHQSVLAALEARLRRVVDPEEADRRAKADQAALVERHGGREAVIAIGNSFASPPPGEKEYGEEERLDEPGDGASPSHPHVQDQGDGDEG